MKWKVSLENSSMMSLIFLSFIMIVLGCKMLMIDMVKVIEWDFFSIMGVSVVFTLVFDFISLLFLGVVFLISGSVLFYSGGYMLGDKSYDRFMLLVLAFVGSMSMMVLSPNMISILLGWDGLGFVSYALVIYYQNEKSSAAGMLTVLSNRVGDVAILMSIGLMSSMGGWNFFISAFTMLEEMSLVKWFVVIAATTKSAQIPFSAWLPAAMAAPTPVSALVHSSTLVTAGVYLMIRFYPALDGSMTKSYLLIISCLTMFMSGVGANFEFDLKKIIALSTLSQLGVMLSSLAMGFKMLSFFHLLSHALFKALLFMCAGQVIHNVGGYQDIRLMGGMSSSLPLTLSYMTLSNLALCGFPFLAGFYSKDLVLEMAFLSWVNLVVLALYVVATGMTVAYTLRLIFFTTTGEYNFLVLNAMKDEDKKMINSMTLLGIGAVSGGSMLSWVLFPEPYMVCMSLTMKLLVLVISGMGALFGYIFNLMNLNYKLMGVKFYESSSFLGSMWNLPILSTLKNNYSVFFYGNYLLKMGDKGWYEFFGAQGLNFLFSKIFFILNYLHVNSVKLFMKVFLISVVVMIFIML
uniref:NADH dehydrogenase subunit 5 n=1 Tax=Myra affinis TaxID=2800677 RepID=UPI001FAFE521|nr:NADH dehydrogenase subunit 5 [Myra affinis]UJP67370.1 NADH dehydrogenase subunit 5 [Myra affinis]